MSDIVKPRFEPCAICDNTGWVCEGHGNHPWRGVSNRPDSCDFGPGMPCPSSTCEHSLDRRDDDDTAALRAEVERLRAGNEDMRHTIHQWEPNMAALCAENERFKAALGHIADERLSSSDEVQYLKQFARAILDGQDAPSPWRPVELIMAANAIIDFYNGPVEAKRPDIFQRLMQRLANAIPPAPGKEEA